MTSPISPSGSSDRRGIEEMLRRCALGVQGVAPGVWRAELRGHTVPFPLWVSDEGQLVRLVISPLLVGPKDFERGPALHDRLLRLNLSIRMARFAVTPGGDVELMTEMVAAHIDAGELSDCVRGLLYYADRYFGQLAALCRAPSRPPPTAS